MNDFDISLIREFKKRPAFYDRESKNFKDKLHNAQAWQEISNTLGYDVALLKDRMLQLRNRFNLEKRRSENLSMDRPGSNAQSPWPLYDHLNFLSSHIRSRRSFKLKMGDTPSDVSHSGSNKPLDTATTNLNLKKPLTIKLENGTDESESVDEQVTRRSSGRKKINQAIEKSANNSGLKHAFENKNVPMRNVESVKTLASKRNQENNDGVNEVPEKRSRLQKYEDFGKFISSSLVEMPTEKALLLVEKFTSDLVKVLIEKNHSKNNSVHFEEQIMNISDSDTH